MPVSMQYPISQSSHQPRSRPLIDLTEGRQLSIGPEAALSLLIGQMISEVVYGDPHVVHKHPHKEAAAVALVTTFQVGIITLGLGLLRLGFLDVVLSRALLRGFLTAIGCVSHVQGHSDHMLIKDYSYRADSPDARTSICVESSR